MCNNYYTKLKLSLLWILSSKISLQHYSAATFKWIKLNYDFVWIKHVCCLLAMYNTHWSFWRVYLLYLYVQCEYLKQTMKTNHYPAEIFLISSRIICVRIIWYTYIFKIFYDVLFLTSGQIIMPQYIMQIWMHKLRFFY